MAAWTGTRAKRKKRERVRNIKRDTDSELTSRNQWKYPQINFLDACYPSTEWREKKIPESEKPGDGSFFSFPDVAYLHHWLLVTIHFNRYNLCFYKYTECRDKCKSLYLIVLHIRVVPPSFNPFVECPLSDTTCWTIGYSHMDVTERLLNTKVVVFLGFLWFAVDFLLVKYNEIFDSLEKV